MISPGAVSVKEAKGPIDQQIEAAMVFVKKHINLGSRIADVYREDIFKLPMDSVRELISNAVCHRLCKALHNLCYVKSLVMQSWLQNPKGTRESGAFFFA